MRFLASVVSQSFLAFGDILELNRKLVELSGGVNRIFELEELLDAAHSGTRHPYFVLYANMPFKLLSSCLCIEVILYHCHHVLMFSFMYRGTH